MEKIFDKLPYDRLDNIKFSYLLAGAFGVGLLLYIGFHLTVYNVFLMQFDSLQAKKTQTRGKLQAYQALIGTQDQVNAELAAVQGELAQIKSQMPRRQEIVNFLKQVSDIGAALGVNIVFVRSLPEKVNGFYKETPVRINIQGGFYKTMSFLDAVQNLLHLVNLTQVRMETVDSDVATGGKVLETSSVAVAYSYVEGAEDQPAAPKKKT